MMIIQEWYKMNLTKREDKFGYVIGGALHGIADNLEVSERVKQKIDKQITERKDKSIEQNHLRCDMAE